MLHEEDPSHDLIRYTRRPSLEHKEVSFQGSFFLLLPKLNGLLSSSLELFPFDLYHLSEPVEPTLTLVFCAVLV